MMKRLIYKSTLQHALKNTLRNAFLFLALLLFSCANDTATPSGNPPLRGGSITLYQEQINLSLDYLNVDVRTNGATEPVIVSGPAFSINGLIESYEPADARLTYESSDPALVSISDSGLLTVLANPPAQTNVVISLKLSGTSNATNSLNVFFVPNDGTTLLDTNLSESAEPNAANDSCLVKFNKLEFFATSIRGGTGNFNIQTNGVSGGTELLSYGTGNDAIIRETTHSYASRFTNADVKMSIAGVPEFEIDGTQQIGYVPKIVHMSVEILREDDAGQVNDDFYYLVGIGSIVERVAQRVTTRYAYNHSCERVRTSS